MIRLSASLISDILVCTMRGNYRVNYSEQSIETPEMALGNVVHKSIERYWNDEDRALNLSYDLAVKGGLDEEYAKELVKNYFTYFKQMCSLSDEIEKNFDFVLFDDVHLVGKLDRVNLAEGMVFDWKTSKPRNVPQSLSTNIQFIIYDYAFRRLYNKPASLVAYASLTTGKLIKFEEDKFFSRYLFEDVIPRVVNTIKSNNYSRDGLFGMYDPKHKMSYSCFYCSFKDFCWGQEFE